MSGVTLLVVLLVFKASSAQTQSSDNTSMPSTATNTTAATTATTAATTTATTTTTPRNCSTDVFIKYSHKRSRGHNVYQYNSKKELCESKCLENCECEGYSWLAFTNKTGKCVHAFPSHNVWNTWYIYIWYHYIRFDVYPCHVDNGGCDHKCDVPRKDEVVCSCRGGFIFHNETQCTDPCEENNGGCEQECSVKENEKVCGCNEGFLVDADNSSACYSPCATHGCSDGCSLVDEAPVCSCPREFELEEDGLTCYHLCSKNNGGCDHICTVRRQRAVCSCNRGYVLDSDDNSRCHDVCAMDNGGCQQLCTVPNNQLLCACYPGYEVDPRFISTCRVELPDCVDTFEEYADVEIWNQKGDYKGYNMSVERCRLLCLNIYSCSGLEFSRRNKACHLFYSLPLHRRSNRYRTDHYRRIRCNPYTPVIVPTTTPQPVDLCGTENGGCSQLCTVVNEQVVCACEDEYVVDPVNNTQCNDPCRENKGGCNHRCSVKNHQVVCSCLHHYYVDKDNPTRCIEVSHPPRVAAIQPTAGPVGGNTAITLYGEYFVPGVLVRFDNRFSKFQSSTENEAIVMTPAVDQSWDGRELALLLKFPGHKTVFTDFKFTYNQGPFTVDSLTPVTQHTSGGSTLTVGGQNLRGVTTATLEIVMTYKLDSNPRQMTETYNSDCKVKNSIEITCPTPRIELPERFRQWDQRVVSKDSDLDPSVAGLLSIVRGGTVNVRSDLSVDIDYGSLYLRFAASVKLDDLQQISTSLLLFDSPPSVTAGSYAAFYPFNEDIQIKSEGLNRGFSASDYKVRIGTGWCTVSKVTATEITCRIPDYQPERSLTGDGISKRYYPPGFPVVLRLEMRAVTVFAGPNLELDGGTFVYNLTQDVGDGTRRSPMPDARAAYAFALGSTGEKAPAPRGGDNYMFGSGSSHDVQKAEGVVGRSDQSAAGYDATVMALAAVSGMLGVIAVIGLAVFVKHRVGLQNMSQQSATQLHRRYRDNSSL